MRRRGRGWERDGLGWEGLREREVAKDDRDYGEERVGGREREVARDRESGRGRERGREVSIHVIDGERGCQRWERLRKTDRLTEMEEMERDVAKYGSGFEREIC